MPAISARTLLTVPTGAGLSSSTVLFICVLAFFSASGLVALIVWGAKRLAQLYRRTHPEDVEAARSEPMSTLTPYDLKSLGHVCIPHIALQAESGYLYKPSPAIVLTSPSTDASVLVPPSRPECPTTVPTPVIGGTSLASLKLPALPLEVSQHYEGSARDDDVALEKSIGLALIGLSLVNGSFSEQDIGSLSSCDDLDFCASKASVDMLLTPPALSQSTDHVILQVVCSAPSEADIGSTGLLGNVFVDDSSSEGESNGSLSVCSSGESDLVQVLPTPTSRASTCFSPNPSVDHSLPSEVWNTLSDDGTSGAEADWNAVLANNGLGDFVLSAELPAAQDTVRLAKDEAPRTILRNTAERAAPYAWWRDDLCTFDSFASRKRHARNLGKENQAGSF